MAETRAQLKEKLRKRLGHMKNKRVGRLYKEVRENGKKEKNKKDLKKIQKQGLDGICSSFGITDPKLRTSIRKAIQRGDVASMEELKRLLTQTKEQQKKQDETKIPDELLPEREIVPTLPSAQPQRRTLRKLTVPRPQISLPK